MRPLTVTLAADPSTIRLLATWEADDCLRAALPNPPDDPSAPTALLEALSLWTGIRVDAAIAVGPRDLAGTALDLWGGVLLPDDTDRVGFRLVADRRPYRLRGPGNFADLYRRHGRGL